MMRVLPSSALAEWRPFGWHSGLDGTFGGSGLRQPYGWREQANERRSRLRYGGGVSDLEDVK